MGQHSAADKVGHSWMNTKMVAAQREAYLRRASTKTGASDGGAPARQYLPGISSRFHWRTGTTTKTYGAETDMANNGAAVALADGGRRRR